MSDPAENPIRKLDHPAVYIGGSLLAIFGNAFGYFDFYMMLLVVGAGIYGMVAWFRRKPAD